MTIKKLVLVTKSIVFAGACTWLGFWQLRRLHEKQSYNTAIAARRFLPAIPLESLPHDTAVSKFRRVKLEGKYDYSNQIVWSLRGRDGSPGVNILTPLLRPGNDTALLVDRGWVYSPDATTVELARWNETDSLSGEGYILPLHAGAGSVAQGANRTFRTLDRSALSKVFPYPIAPVFAVLTTLSPDSTKTPPRVTLIPLDEGSHKSYAFQWFSFAAISIIGAGIFIRKT